MNTLLTVLFLFLTERQSQTFVEMTHANHFTNIVCTVISIPMIHRHSAQCVLTDARTQQRLTLWKQVEVNQLTSFLKSAGVVPTPLHPERIGDSSYQLSAAAIDCTGEPVQCQITPWF